MALVNYSDSESDTEDAPPHTLPPAPKPANAKPLAQKLVDRKEPNRIRVNLPSIQPEPGQQDDVSEERAPKRAKTSGAFSGFNSLLPAPKNRNVLKKGVSLKTSSEAAFSRNPLPVAEQQDFRDDAGTANTAQETRTNGLSSGLDAVAEEPKVVGKPTRFMPLSVANKKKKPTKVKPPVADASIAAAENLDVQPKVSDPILTEPVKPTPKPKAPLFSFGQERGAVPASQPGTNGYEPEFAADKSAAEATMAPEQQTYQPPPDPGSLSSVANDLNLTPAQRRQLFGRNAKDPTAAASIAHFDMDAEYKANQELAASGESVEHRTVKTIAPGKHSLQQLVNNVRSQQDALEDKWAQGKASRGEAGSRYGWGK